MKKYQINMKAYYVKLVLSIFFVITMILVFGVDGRSRREMEREYARECENAYRCGYYDQLYSCVTYFHDVGKEYKVWDIKVYDEILEAYDDYLTWHGWYECAMDESIENAAEMEEECRQKVYENLEECRYEDNYNRLEWFVEDMESEL